MNHHLGHPEICKHALDQSPQTPKNTFYCTWAIHRNASHAIQYRESCQRFLLAPLQALALTLTSRLLNDLLTCMRVSYGRRRLLSSVVRTNVVFPSCSSCFCTPGAAGVSIGIIAWACRTIKGLADGAQDTLSSLSLQKA